MGVFERWWAPGIPSPAWAAALAVSLTSCVAEAPETPVPDELLETLSGSEYAYFRFTNREFARRVCEELGEHALSAPAVNLHGDAHVEQYAVMSGGRGLMDFDDSARGPAMIDLVRFGVSIAIAARLNGWQEHTDALVAELWRGYQDGLAEPDALAPVPSLVARIAERFDDDRASFLEEAEALMEPGASTPDAVGPELRQGLSLLREALSAEYPERRERFFEVKRVGAHRQGIGSALTEKYLIRVEGETDAENDDVILEAKLLRELKDVPCVRRGRSDPFPVLIAQSRLAYRPYDFAGFMYLDPSRAQGSPLGASYWDGSVYIVHSWIDQYQELSAEGSFRSIRELKEVVYDSGVQLGRGHGAGLTGELDPLRGAVAELARNGHEDLIRLVDELGGEWEERWRSFRAAPEEGAR